MSESQRHRILSGLKTQNEPAIYYGVRGFWIQGQSCFIPGECAQEAFRQYSAGGQGGLSHNHNCADIGWMKLFECADSLGAGATFRDVWRKYSDQRRAELDAHLAYQESQDE